MSLFNTHATPDPNAYAVRPIPQTSLSFYARDVAFRHNDCLSTCYLGICTVSISWLTSMPGCGEGGNKIAEPRPEEVEGLSKRRLTRVKRTSGPRGASVSQPMSRLTALRAKARRQMSFHGAPQRQLQWVGPRNHRCGLLRLLRKGKSRHQCRDRQRVFLVKELHP